MKEDDDQEHHEPDEPSSDAGFTSRSMRSFSELHADAWQVVRHNPILFLFVPIIVWFPFDLLAEHVAQAGGDDFWSYMRSYLRVSRITQFFVGGWVTVVVLVGTHQLAHQSTASLGRALLEGSKRYARILGVMFSFGWRVTLATLLLIVPGVIFALSYAVCLPVAIFEDRGGRDALEWSKYYMTGGRLKLLKYVVVAILIYFPGAYGFGFIIAENETPLLGAISSIPFNAVGALFTIALVMVYADATGKPEFARPIGSRAPQEDYTLQARGQSPSRPTVRIALTISLLLFAVGSYNLVTAPLFEGEKINFGEYNDELYYDDSVSEAEVQRMGDALLEVGYFGSDEPMALKLRSDGSSYLLYFYVEKDWWSRPDIKEGLQSLQDYLSDGVMDRPVQIIMTEETMSGWEERPVGPITY